MAPGLTGYTYHDYPSQQQNTTGAQRVRGHRAVAGGFTHDDAEDDDDEDDGEYYRGSDDDVTSAGASEQPVPPQLPQQVLNQPQQVPQQVPPPAMATSQAAYYLPQQQQPAVMPQMPGPGFFSSHVTSAGSGSQLTPPAPLIAQKPLALGATTPSAQAPMLAGMLGGNTSLTS